MSERVWNRSTVIAAIRAEARAGQDLSYSRTEKRVPSLLHAAQRVFGHWSAAISAAGFDYEAIRRYRKWTREMVVARIRAWHAQGADLSWRNVSVDLDPPLAAAALHAGRFESWNEALLAAGLDPEKIARYRRWSSPTIQAELEKLAKDGKTLDQESIAGTSPALLAAIYRVGAGLVAERILLQDRLRDPGHLHSAAGVRERVRQDAHLRKLLYPAARN